MNETRVGNRAAVPGHLQLTDFVVTLILAVLVSAIVGGYLLYQRAGSRALLFNPHATRIAFMTNRDGNWEIYIMDRDGGNPTNLTNNPGNDGVPVHTPGQAHLAFISDRDNSSLDLFIMDLDGSNVTNLTQSPEGNEIPITWSPGGEYLAFANDQSGVSEICLIKTNGEGLINLSQRDNAQTFDDWSPTTDRLLVSASSEVGISPLITDPEGNTPQPLTDRSFPAGGGRWSPDGNKIALMAMAPGTTTIDIFVLDLASGEMINLTQSPSSDRFPRWSPDGSKIAFVSDRDGNPEIYVMNTDGSNLINLTNSPTVESIQGDFAWSPDGSQILFHTNRDGNLEIYLMNADGSNPANLTNSPETDLNAIWVQQ